MGWFMKEAHARVVLVGLSPEVSKALKPILLKSGVDDPGRVELHEVKNIAECKELLEAMSGRGAPGNNKKKRSEGITGICIDFERCGADESVAFIAEVRTTHPLIAFCLVGTKKYLTSFPGLHANWKERFRHYFQLWTDQKEGDFAQNAGALRDLLIADVVKCTALGQYQTTPGALVRLKAASPYGFWIQLVVVGLTALLAGAVGPIVNRMIERHDRAQKQEAAVEAPRATDVPGAMPER
jgi:hypothetical protein